MGDEHLSPTAQTLAASQERKDSWTKGREDEPQCFFAPICLTLVNKAPHSSKNGRERNFIFATFSGCII